MQVVKPKTETLEEWSKRLNARHFKYPYKKIYNKVLKCAKDKKLDVDLTYEEFVDFTKIKNCHYCWSL